jgi:uncharacterized protein YcfJ
MTLRTALIAGTAAMVLGACQQPFAQAPAATGATGAALGAAGGAAAGQLIGGDTESTIIGGTLGAVGGGLIGTEAERQRLQQQQAQGVPPAQPMTGQRVIR